MKKALLWIGPILIVVGLFMALGASTSIAKIKENEKINGLADAMSLSDRDLCGFRQCICHIQERLWPSAPRPL
jgi:hypothetical protein